MPRTAALLCAALIVVCCHTGCNADESPAGGVAAPAVPSLRRRVDGAHTSVTRDGHPTLDDAGEGELSVAAVVVVLHVAGQGRVAAGVMEGGVCNCLSLWCDVAPCHVAA
jgi:hypothetical protein